MSPTEIALYFSVGVLLGGLYLGALWLTVTRLKRTAKPLFLLAVSGLVRVALLLGALAFVTGLDWKRLLVCAAGFLAARLMATAWARPEPARRDGLS